ncbi:hypothetical protein NL676_019440 [Syzygium grande]|nr:hypothetical protein NL676_019440 [Syzygium grande]
MASMVWFQCVFAAITVILLAGSVLGRMNFRAWMMFVPLWLTFSYTVGAFSLWGGGFLFHWGVMDYSGGYVIHLSSGTAGLTAAYWVGPRLTKDRERFPPNNVLLMLAGAGLLWLGWAGFNGGDPYTANIDSSVAVLNTNICAATSLLVWTWLDVIFFKKPSVIGAVQGMITGLVCITPAAGLVQGWAAIIMGIMSGSVPWFTMMIVHKRWTLLQKIDDTLGVFHTHAVAGYLGCILTGLFAEPELCSLFLSVTNSRGGCLWRLRRCPDPEADGGRGLHHRMERDGHIDLVQEQLLIGDDAVHGEEAYALWGDGEKYDSTQHEMLSNETRHPKAFSGATQMVSTPPLVRTNAAPTEAERASERAREGAFLSPRAPPPFFLGDGGRARAGIGACLPLVVGASQGLIERWFAIECAQNSSLERITACVEM